MKKIGVVVPIYNAGPYLEPCIESILGQTYRCLELVLVDDGSTDGSGALCDKYREIDKRVHVIHQENQGMLPARYNGLRCLECDYATFVDADDWIETDTYEKMSPYMEQEIDVISFQIIRYFDSAYKCVSHDHYEAGLYSKAEIEEQIYPTMIWDIEKGTFGLEPSLCNKLIKRELLFDELDKANKLTVSYGQDIAVIYPLMTRAQSLMLTREALYYHRQREQHVVQPYIADPGYFEKLYLLYAYIVRQTKDHPIFIKQIDYFYADAARLHLRIYGDKKKGMGYLFPFNRVPVGKKIILYGASTLGQIFYDQIHRLDYGDIVAWVDRSYGSYEQFGVREIEYIKTVEEYDHIVIAVLDQETAKAIKRDLIDMGIDSKKIVCMKG